MVNVLVLSSSGVCARLSERVLILSVLKRRVLLGKPFFALSCLAHITMATHQPLRASAKLTV